MALTFPATVRFAPMAIKDFITIAVDMSDAKYEFDSGGSYVTFENERQLKTFWWWLKEAAKDEMIGDDEKRDVLAAMEHVKTSLGI
jgi:hypothetical protein